MDISQCTPGFLKVLLSAISMHVCLCVSAMRLLIARGIVCTLYDWLNFYSFYMVAVVISSGRSLSIKACCRNQPNKSKLVLYKPFFTLTVALNSYT